MFEIHPILKEIKETLYSAGAVYASMTGTGSSIYGIFEKDIPEKHIEVATTDKIVALRGIVDTKLQADRAIEVAFSIDNVLDVTDHLKVRNSSSVITDSLLTAKTKGKIRHLSINKKIFAPDKTSCPKNKWIK